MNWKAIEHGSHATSNFVKNWTSPFFENVFFTLNSSMYGPRAIRIAKSLDDWIEDEFSPAAQYGIMTAMAIILLMNSTFLKNENLKNVLTFYWPEFVNIQSFLMAMSLGVFMLISPLLICIYLLFYTYKLIITIMLKRKHGKDFVKMMDSLDVVWAVEEDNARSVINVIAYVEPQLLSPHCKNGCFLKKIKNSIQSTLFGSDSVCPKMFYKKNFEYGYYFWTHNKQRNIEDYIKHMDLDESIEMNEEMLKLYVEEQLNSPLPNNNSVAWEMLVSKQPLNGTKSIPILFRLHHCLGDGVALLNLLLNTIGTTNTLQVEKVKLSQFGAIKNCITNLFDLFNVRKLIRPIQKCIATGIKFVTIMCLMPGSLLNQGLRPADFNMVHGPELNGNKVISWVSDENLDESLLIRIKRLRRNLPGVTFSELIITALSVSFQKYFMNQDEGVLKPDMITAVVPVRMTSADNSLNKRCNKSKLKMENKFSVAMLSIPLINSDKDKSCTSILQRLMVVRKETNKLRCSADFYVNYWIMKIGGSIFPESIFKPLLTSVQASLVISNLPGPSDVIICEDYKVNKMAFFVPHRGTTGIGVTILSCNNRINFGIMIDSALVKDSQGGCFILTNMMKELESLDYILTSNKKQSLKNW